MTNVNLVKYFGLYEIRSFVGCYDSRNANEILEFSKVELESIICNIVL